MANGQTAGRVERPARHRVVGLVVERVAPGRDRAGVEAVDPPVTGLQEALDAVEGAQDVRPVADADETLRAVGQQLPARPQREACGLAAERQRHIGEALQQVNAGLVDRALGRLLAFGPGGDELPEQPDVRAEVQVRQR